MVEMAGELGAPPFMMRHGGVKGIALSGLALLLVLLIGGSVALTLMTRGPQAAQANLDSSGISSHDAVGCASQGQLDRYYQDGENNRDLAPLLTAGGGCRVIAKASGYTVVAAGLFVSRVLVSSDGVQTPFYVTNASIR